MQHLLLGMNAHINLDLGIAAALAAPGDQLVALGRDFIQINTVLARLVESEEASLGKIWPPLRVLTWGTADDVIINFSMAQARDEAWNFALQLSRASETEREHLIAARDQHIACLALSLIRPSLVLRPLLLPIRVAERGSVAQKIPVLSQD